MHYIIVSCANVTYNPKGRFVKKVSIQPLFLLQNWVPSSVVLACDRTSTISYSVFFKAILKFLLFLQGILKF